MRKRNPVNLLLVVAAVFLVAVFAFSVRLEASADRVTVLTADGITCGGCVARINRALEAEHGVASVSVDEAAGRVVVAHDSRAVIRRPSPPRRWQSGSLPQGMAAGSSRLRLLRNTARPPAGCFLSGRHGGAGARRTNNRWWSQTILKAVLAPPEACLFVVAGA